VANLLGNRSGWTLYTEIDSVLSKNTKEICMSYDTIVCIGRFEPVHSAHEEILKRACRMAKHVIVVVGSTNQPRTFKNPFTFSERVAMLTAVLERVSGTSTYSIHANLDSIYNNEAWAQRIQEIVLANSPSKNIAIIGHKKDSSSFYLDMFPQWPLELVENIEALDATTIRDLYFKQPNNLKFVSQVVPKETLEFLQQFQTSLAFDEICKEREFISKYKAPYAALPYPVTFVTTDAVVIQSAHVLMIKRKAYPGKGLWALPGGFLNANTDESLQACALRELREETALKVPKPVLIGSIKATRTFDALNRSTRGRTITTAFKIQLADSHSLPKIKAQDDAAQAKWIPFAELDPSVIYEDHYDIIQWAINT